MTLDDLSDNQLDRVYRRLYRSLPSGDPFGWDFPTLFLLYPAKAVLMRQIIAMLRERDDARKAARSVALT